MTQEIDYTKFIDRYLEDSMSLEEKNWFEKELEGNSSLQQDLDFHRKVNAVLSDKETIMLKEQLEKIHQEIAEKKEEEQSALAKINSPKVFTMITAIALLFGFVFYDTTKDYASEDILSEYYEPVNAVENFRAFSDADQQISEAISLYEEKAYASAIKLFEEVLLEDPDMIGVNLYSGISYMELENYSSANDRFQKIIAQDPNPFVESATWYLGMCYLYTDEKDKAKSTFELLVHKDGYYKKEAKKILRRL